MGSIKNWCETINQRRVESRQDRRLVFTARVLAALIVLVGVLDVISTNAALAAGYMESNVLIAAIQAVWGVWWFIPKLAVHVALAAFVLWLPSKRMIWNARAGIMIYAVVIAANMHVADWQVI